MGALPVTLRIEAWECMCMRAQAHQAMGFSYYYSPGSAVSPAAMSLEEGVLAQAAEAALALAQATSSEAALLPGLQPAPLLRLFLHQVWCLSSRHAKAALLGDLSCA